MTIKLKMEKIEQVLTNWLMTNEMVLITINEIPMDKSSHLKIFIECGSSFPFPFTILCF